MLVDVVTLVVARVVVSKLVVELCLTVVEFKFPVDLEIGFDVVFKVVNVIVDCDLVFVFEGEAVVICVVKVVSWLSLTSIERTPIVEGLAGSVMLEQLM